MRKLFLVSLCLLFLAARRPAVPISSANPFESAFWSHWGDGRAELSGYDLIIPRYGELRRGTAVAIFVTEPFSNAVRVKADPGKHPDSDVFQVLKLNLVRDFPTGIYDYNLMTSAFVAVQPVASLQPGEPAKISFSSQEWCGHVYQQITVRPPSVSLQMHSYFDGEADDRRKLDWRRGGIAEDTLFFWARGLGAPFMRSGENRELPLLPSLMTSRLSHRPVRWKTVQLSVDSSPQRISVPAGDFDVEVRTATIDDGRSWIFYIEQAEPRRIIKWSASDGEQGELLGSERLAYWQMNAGEFNSAVQKLGLTPRNPRTP
jgi:hypothetical protein